jgi:hypothetical protein
MSLARAAMIKRKRGEVEDEDEGGPARRRGEYPSTTTTMSGKFFLDSYFTCQSWLTARDSDSMPPPPLQAQDSMEVMFENERQREVSLTPTERSGGRTPQPRRKRPNINYAEDTFTSSEINADITSSDNKIFLQLGNRSDYRQRRKFR